MDVESFILLWRFGELLCSFVKNTWMMRLVFVTWRNSLEKLNDIVPCLPFASLESLRSEAVANCMYHASHRSDAHHDDMYHFMVVQVIDTNVARHVNSSGVLSHLLNRYHVNKDLCFLIGSFITPIKLQPPDDEQYISSHQARKGKTTKLWHRLIRTHCIYETKSLCSD